MPSTATVAVLGLAAAVILAVGAAVLPALRVPLLVVAVALAVPSGAVALRRTRSMPGGDRDLVALGRDASLTDPLTGAGNGAALEAALDAAVLDPTTLPLTLVRVALAAAPDGDTELRAERQAALGASDFHLAGDPDLDLERDRDQGRRLVLAAVRWLEILRPGDLLVRTDGNEFAVVLSRCNARAARAVITRLQAAVPDGAVAAVGVACWDGDESVTALRRRADVALDTERHVLTHDPISDPARVAAAKATGLALRHPLAEFDEIAAGVAWLLRTPIVVITLFDESWQHFIGQSGVDTAGAPTEGTPVREAICRQTVATGRPLVVSDTTRHPELRNVPAARDLGVLACASVPVTSPEGHVLGSVCSMVLERHTWTAEDVGLLKLTAARISERLSEVPVHAASAA